MDKVSLYRDGMLVAGDETGSCGTDYAPRTSTSGVYIGNTGSDVFAGYIDHVRIRQGAHSSILPSR